MKPAMMSIGIPGILMALFLAMPNAANADPPGPLTNGDFEGDSPEPWRERHGAVPANAQKPVRTDGNGYEDSKCVTMGRVALKGPQGANPSIVIQAFDCGNSGDFCTVTFKAMFLQSGEWEKATVGLVSGGGHISWDIPASQDWEEHTVSVPGCSEESIVNFALHSDSLSFCEPILLASQLRIDDVSASCTVDDQSSLTPGTGPTEIPPEENDLLAFADSTSECLVVASPSGYYFCETQPLCSVVFEGECVWDSGVEDCVCETIGMGGVRFGLAQEARHEMTMLEIDAPEGSPVEVWHAHREGDELSMMFMLGAGTAGTDNRATIAMIEPLDCGMELAVIDVAHGTAVTGIIVGWPPAQIPCVADFVAVLLGLNPNPPDVAACDFNADGFVDGADIEGYLALALAS